MGSTPGKAPGRMDSGGPTARERKVDLKVAKGGRGRENGEREVLLVKGRPELDGVGGETCVVGARVDGGNSRLTHVKGD